MEIGQLTRREGCRALWATRPEVLSQLAWLMAAPEAADPVCCPAEITEGDSPETSLWGRQERHFEARLYVRMKVTERAVLQIMLRFLEHDLRFALNHALSCSKSSIASRST